MDGLWAIGDDVLEGGLYSYRCYYVIPPVSESWTLNLKGGVTNSFYIQNKLSRVLNLR